jgi:hypothetical protein
MAIAIGHAEGERIILDAIREIRPPFSPDDAILVKAPRELHEQHRIGELANGLGHVFRAVRAAR